MAINKNHLFEDIDNIKCAIVESGISAERVEFIKSILTYNGYTVLVIEETNAKQKTEQDSIENAEAIKTYKVGTSDVTFNVTNAIFGRNLKTRTGEIVTLKYWNQEENKPDDSIPYFETKLTWK
jgi:hypothetical protein